MKHAAVTALLVIATSFLGFAEDFFSLNESGWSQRVVRRTPVTTTTGISNSGGAATVQDYDGNTFYQDKSCRLYKVTSSGTETLFASGLSTAFRFCYGLTFTPGRKSFLILVDIDQSQTDRAIVEIYPSSLNPPPPPSGVAPFGYVDVPASNATFARQSTVVIAGWTLASAGIGHVDIIGISRGLGGDLEVVLGSATLGFSRPDVLNAFPAFNNPDSGWVFSISSSTLLSSLTLTGLAGSPLTIIVRAFDRNGIMTEIKRFSITIATTMVIE